MLFYNNSEDPTKDMPDPPAEPHVSTVMNTNKVPADCQYE